MVALMMLHSTNGSNHGAKDTITEWWVITTIGGPLSAGTSSLSTLSFWHDDWVVLFAIAFNDETTSGPLPKGISLSNDCQTYFYWCTSQSEFHINQSTPIGITDVTVRLCVTFEFLTVSRNLHFLM